MASQACCDAGPAITSDYEPKGTISKVKDFDVYKVGSGPATVVIVYDIFGLSKQAKQVLSFCQQQLQSFDHICR
jgi:dienelactone hydrolase